MIYGERSIMTGVRIKMIAGGNKLSDLEERVNHALEELEASNANIIDVQYCPKIESCAGGGSIYTFNNAMIKYYPG